MMFKIIFKEEKFCHMAVNIVVYSKQYTRGDQKVLQLDILDWKFFQILYTSKHVFIPYS